MKPEAPSYLEASQHGEIAQLMLTELIPDGINRTALTAVTPDISFGFFGVPDPVDKSFSAQIRQASYDYHSIGSDFESAPDAYLVTALSAVPVADAVRGYYDAAGLPLPLIESVRANRTLAELLSVSKESAGKEMDKEIIRLGWLLNGAQHICVIDQYTASGNTLNYAGEILRRAGVLNISAIRGQWYHQAYISDLDIEYLTSCHIDIMQKIGHLSCKTTASI